MLKVCGLQAERDDRILFSSLTFELAPGSLLTVTGPNGSGKSTLLKILVGLLPRSEGSVTWESKPFPLSTESLAKDSSGEFLYFGHKTGVQPALTPLENLKWFLGLQNSHQQIQEKNLLSALKALGLRGYEAIPCETLSCGQRQRVALARLWLQAPKIWILDEPFTALDSVAQTLLCNRFLMHLKAGGLIIIASHLSLFNLESIPQLQITLGRLEDQIEEQKC